MRRAASSPPARSWACDRASPCASTRTSRSAAPGCGWAAVRSSSASTPSRCRELLRELDAAGVDLLGFHVFAGSQNLSADLLVQAQTRTVELVLALAADAPQPVRYVNLGGGFGVPYFPQDQPLDIAAVAANLTRAGRDAARAGAPGRRARHRARPLPRRRGRRLRHAGRRPEGLARQHLPRGRRRDAPPARRVRQPRPGDPPQLPARGRGADLGRARGDGRPSSAASAPRSTCSATASSCRGPTSATSSSSSRPAPTG